VEYRDASQVGDLVNVHHPQLCRLVPLPRANVLGPADAIADVRGLPHRGALLRVRLDVVDMRVTVPRVRGP